MSTAAVTGNPNVTSSSTASGKTDGAKSGSSMVKVGLESLLIAGIGAAVFAFAL